MSFANGTTYYNLPQTVGTDKRDWFDTNTPFANVDTDLHEAVTKARESATDITVLAGRVSNVETAQSSQAQDIVDIKATQQSQASAITSLGNKIDDVEDDALDMICAVDEGTAQVATVAVNEGHYFRYNNVLYMATADIAIGDTIVPNTNCRATNVATELESIDMSAIPQLQSDVSQLQTDIGKNELGTAVSLTEGTEYTFPSDGYVTVHAPQGATYCLVRIYGATASSASYLQVQVTGGGTQATDNVFVRKGMRAELISQSGDGFAEFTPLV